MSKPFENGRRACAATILTAAAAAALTLAAAGPASAHRALQSFGQPEQRAANGRITVEASTITIIACDGPGERGGQYYIYAYQKRPGFRAILPPNWGSPIGGRDMATFQQAANAACFAGGAVTPPAQTRGTMSGWWGGYEFVQTGNTFTWRVGGELGRGTINGDSVQASWGPASNPGQIIGSATGRVTGRNANGDPVRIEWSNGVVFTR